MSMPFDIYGTIIIVSIAVGYVALVWRVSEIAKPIREKLFDLGDEVARDEQLPLDRVDYVNMMLERALSPLEAVKLALVLIPTSAIRVAYTSVRHAMGANQGSSVPISETPASLRRFYIYVVYSACLANPVVGVLVVLELLLIAMFGLMPGKLVTAAIRSASNNPIRSNGLAH